MALKENRDQKIDFFRGIIILDMVLVHFSYFLPSLFLKKIILYHDIAVEGFIFISGYMVGYYYFSKFQSNAKDTTKILLSRVLKIIYIQYIMIATITLPIHLIQSGSFSITWREGQL